MMPGVVLNFARGGPRPVSLRAGALEQIYGLGHAGREHGLAHSVIFDHGEAGLARVVLPVARIASCREVMRTYIWTLGVVNISRSKVLPTGRQEQITTSGCRVRRVAAAVIWVTFLVCSRPGRSSCSHLWP